MSSTRDTRRNLFNACTQKHGFTLLEMVIAILSASMLMVGLSSALYLTMQATEPDLGGHQSKLEADQALGDLTSELRFAKAFTTRDVHAVEFTVADRNGDTNDETIRWEWSGIATDPLTRQYNGGSIIDVVENVYAFDLSYNLDEVTTVESGSGEVVSDEYMMANFEGWSGVTPNMIAYNMSPTTRAAESFVVQGIPAEATAVTITRASFRLRKNAGGTLQVSVHKTLGGGNIEPESSQIGTGATVNVASLPVSFEWVDINFIDVEVSGYQDEFVIIMEGSISNAAAVEYYYSYSAPADSTYMLYGNTSWSPPAFLRDRYDIPFRVYGTYTLASGGETEVTRYFVVSSEATVQVGADSTTQRNCSAAVLNRPEVLAP